MITCMSLKIEKENIFFYTIINHARGIKEKDKINMFLYRFIAGIRAILKRDTRGVKHFKYIEHRHPRQLKLAV